jgi:sugar lactone lactonase YvrE
LIALLSVPAGSTALDEAGAAGSVAFVRQARVLEAERTGIPSPVGLAFSSASDSFYVVDSRPERGSAPAATDVVRLKPFEWRPYSDRVGSARITAAVQDPVNMAFDVRRGRLLLLTGNAGQLLEVQAGSNGDLDPRTLARHDARRFGLEDPRGMAVDPTSGDVFFLDAGLPRIVRVQPEVDGSFDRAVISEVDLRKSGATAVRGLAFDPSTGHLHLGSGQKLYELTTAGQVVAVRDLSGFDLANPQGMVFAPSGDQTDEPRQLSLYVADSGGGARESSGQIMELSLTPLVAAAASNFQSSLVNTIDTSAWTPPSPDPSGLAYVSSSNRIMMSDGEVEETVNGITHFAGANVWEMSLNGAVVRTANISTVAPTVVPMTNEPTGVAWNPSTGHYFFTDDNAKRVYNLNPGADGLVGTVDDSWNFFSTNSFGNGDPEGICYDTLSNRLFVADGVNAEIYEYTTVGALIGHFDVLAYGVADPESVECNPASGALFTLSNRQGGPIIVETSTTGALLQTIDVSAVLAAGGRKPAGLAYAPASNGSGAQHFYIADRGIDNNTDPKIIDGKIFELTAPPQLGNQAPQITSDGGGPAATKTVPENQTAVTDVDATDADNDTLTYAIAGGADAAAFTIVSTTGVLSFTAAPDFEAPTDAGANNVYDVTVSVSDGNGGSDSQDIAVTVTNVAENPSPLYFSLQASATIGGVSAANEDILFFDGTGFSLAFDGSDVGIASLRIDAFAWLDADTLLLSFDADKSVPGIAGTVDDSDIVRFDATSLGATTIGSFQLYFDGSDVGLTANGHDVDALELLSGGRILISTRDSVTVSGVSARDEDLLAFIPTSLGNDTAGSFSLYFDGSDVGLGDAGEDVDAAAVDASGRIYLSTDAAFAVPGVSGQDEDVFVFTPSALGPTTAGSYAPTLYFDGSSFGLDTNDLFAIDLP